MRENSGLFGLVYLNICVTDQEYRYASLTTEVQEIIIGDPLTDYAFEWLRTQLIGYQMLVPLDLSQSIIVQRGRSF
jgi:hypothetical protein